MPSISVVQIALSAASALQEEMLAAGISKDVHSKKESALELSKHIPEISMDNTIIKLIAYRFVFRTKATSTITIT